MYDNDTIIYALDLLGVKMRMPVMNMSLWV